MNWAGWPFDPIVWLYLVHQALAPDKGIENSTIWAFQSASFLFKRGGDIWQPPLDPLAYLGCVLTNFCESIPFIHQNWKKWTMLSSYPSEYGLKHPKYSQDWQKERVSSYQGCIRKWPRPKLCERPCKKEDPSSWGESSALFPAQKTVAASLPIGPAGGLEATQTFPWPETSWLHLNQGPLISFYWLQEMAVNCVNK